VFANIGNEFGMTPIFCATFNERYDEKNDEACAECIEILLHHGGDPTITTPDGTTPLQNCIKAGKFPRMTAVLRRVAPETETPPIAPATEDASEATEESSKKRKL
jgi:ankyrin repeat protein